MFAACRWRGVSDRSDPKRAQETQLAEPKLFIKQAECSAVSLKPKTPSLCKHNCSHGRVASSGRGPAPYRLNRPLQAVLFNQATATYQHFIWHSRVVFITLCHHEIVGVRFLFHMMMNLLWKRVTFLWLLWQTLLTRGTSACSAATPPTWPRAWAMATRACRRKARGRRLDGPLGSCSGGGRDRGCASQGYSKSKVSFFQTRANALKHVINK